jgi:hypothetical protein
MVTGAGAGAIVVVLVLLVVVLSDDGMFWMVVTAA